MSAAEQEEKQMGFQMDKDKMYMMPVVFGPAVTPRQKPGGGRWIYDGPGRTTHYKVVCQVSGEKLKSILPEKFTLAGPYVIVTFSALRDLAWLAGKGYDIVHIEIPVFFEGEKDRIRGNFEPVLWEDLTEAILTGREQLGYSKIFGTISTMTEIGHYAVGSICANEFKFLDMIVDLDQPPEDPELLRSLIADPEVRGKFHYRYLPKTGAPFTEAAEEYVCFGPNAWNPPADLDSGDCPPAENHFCRGELVWHRPEWEDTPTQAHIIRFLCDLDFQRYIGAARSVVYSHNDIYDQHRVK